MTKPRQKIKIAYRVLDATGKTIGKMEQEGYNRNNIEWRVKILAKSRFGKDVTVEQLKVTKVEP